VIARLENADYEGHSLTMLQRIAIVLNQRIEINFVPVEGQQEAAEKQSAEKRCPSTELGKSISLLY